jgi:hypothetical protein
MAKTNYTEEILRRLRPKIKLFVEEMTPRMKEISYGVNRASNEDIVAFMAHQLRMMPPEPWIMPDGQTVLVDPFSADLMTGKVTGGRELLRRIQSAGEKVGT